MGTNQTAVHSQLSEVAQGTAEDYWKGQKNCEDTCSFTNNT